MSSLIHAALRFCLHCKVGNSQLRHASLPTWDDCAGLMARSRTSAGWQHAAACQQQQQPVGAACGSRCTWCDAAIDLTSDDASDEDAAPPVRLPAAVSQRPKPTVKRGVTGAKRQLDVPSKQGRMDSFSVVQAPPQVVRRHCCRAVYLLMLSCACELHADHACKTFNGVMW